MQTFRIAFMLFSVITEKQFKVFMNHSSEKSAISAATGVAVFLTILKTTVGLMS